jgi:uncharacterized phage protein gp47/JayE
MAYQRPSLQTIVARVIGDISSRTAGSAYIKSSVERVLAYVLAGVAHSVHGHLEWVVRQLLPTTCDRPVLLAWGVMLDLPVNPATQAVRKATFTGSAGTIAIGDILQDAEGAEWEVTLGGAISAGSVVVTARAALAGSAGNLDSGASLSLVVPIAGIDTDGTVTDETEDGSDEEDTEAYRVRILDELRTPSKGGGPGDYVGWAKEVSGVTRAWEFGNRMGVGTVSLAFVRDGDGSGEDIIPSVGEVETVQAYLDALMPLDMQAVYVQAPNAVLWDATIKLSPNTEATQLAAAAAIAEVFKTESDLETALHVSKIDEAISTAVGEDKHEIVTSTSLDPGTWGLLIPGTITWQAF